MKKFLACLPLLAMLIGCPTSQSQGTGNQAGLLYAANFAQWSVIKGNVSNYSWTTGSFCRVTSGGITFNAFTVGVPVTILDADPSLTEIVTPTAVTITNTGCSIAVSPVHQHANFTFGTATGGMGEAIGYASSATYQVVLTPAWTALGGTTGMITSSIGNTAVTILDQRTSIIVPYTWNGSQYVAHPFAGGSSAGPQGTVQTSNGSGGFQQATAGNITGTLGYMPVNPGLTVYVDNEPSNCTVAGTPYTTQLDCAIATAKNYSNTTNNPSTVMLGTNFYPTCAGVTWPVNSTYGSMSIVGQGVGASFIDLSCNISSPVLDKEENADHSSNGITLRDFTINTLNGSTATCAKLLALQGPTTGRNISCGLSPTATGASAFQIGESSNYATDLYLDNIGLTSPYAYPTQEANLSVAPSAGGVGSVTIVNGGSGYGGNANLQVIFSGTNGGTSDKPCTSMPTGWTATETGGVITAVNPGTQGSGCGGTIYAQAQQIAQVAVGMDLWVSDSEFHSLVPTVGSQYGIKFEGSNNKIYGTHPTTIQNGIWVAGPNHFDGTECDTLGAWCFDIQHSTYSGLDIVGTNGDVFNHLLPGSATYHFGAGAGDAQLAALSNQCIGGIPTGYNEFLSTAGPITNPANLPSGVTVFGNDPICGIGNSAGNGLQSFNGSTNQNPLLICTGGVACNTTGATTSITYSGSAGSGSVNSGGPWNLANYTPNTTGTTVGPSPNAYISPLGLPSGGTPSFASFFSGLGNTAATLYIQNGDLHTQFSNTKSATAGIVDLRTDHPAYERSVKEWGVQCDARQQLVTSSTTGGVTTLPSGFSATDVGMVAVIVDNVAGVRTSYEDPIVSVTGGAATLAYPLQQDLSGNEWITVGHDDTGAVYSITGGSGFTGAFTAANYASGTYNIALALPAGKCLMHDVHISPQYLHGQGMNETQLVGFPGEDILDLQGGSESHWYGFGVFPDLRINAGVAWNFYDTSGTLHNEAAVYRPAMELTAAADNPMGPAWFQGPGANNSGTLNGVANVTNGSAVICAPTSSGQSLPSVGQQIVFPYTGTGNALFSTTVSSTAGSCGAGFTPFTLAANWPGATLTGPQYAAAQEWFAGTSVQTTATDIPVSRSGFFPATISLTNSIAISPAGESNIAGHGVVKVGSEHFYYEGMAQLTGTITLQYSIENGTGNGTTDWPVGSVIVPENQFYLDAGPWPVTPNLNTKLTPTGAGFFPGMLVGNYGIGAPCVDPTAGCAPGPINSHIDDIASNAWPTSEQVAPDSYTWGFPRSTAFWFVGYPYGTHFHNLELFNNSCFIEGSPSTNTYAWGNTGDGGSMDNVSCHSQQYGASAVIAEGAALHISNWNTYGGGGVGVKAGMGVNIVNLANDHTGNSGGGVVFDSYIANIYFEAGNVPYDSGVSEENDCLTCNIDDWYNEGGGTQYAGGQFQKWKGGQVAPAVLAPFVNYGSSNSFDMLGPAYPPGANTMGSSPWGPNLWLNYGSGTRVNGSVIAVTGALGNTKAPNSGQTAETFQTGNYSVPYTGALDAFMMPNDFIRSTTLDANPLSVGWTYDSTAPVSSSYVACNLGGGALCQTDHFAQGFIPIGPGQRMTYTQYVPYVAMRSTNGNASFTLYFYENYCGSSHYFSTTMNVTSTWAVYKLPVADFSSLASAGSPCTFGLGFSGGSISTQIQMGFLDLAPVWQATTAKEYDVYNSAGNPIPCALSGAGAPSGALTTPSGIACGNGTTYVNTSGALGSLYYIWNGSVWTDIK